MKFNNPRYKEEELTFNDVFLFQQFLEFESRGSIDLKPKSPLSTNIPIISSNMNSVTWKRMAEALARLWWLGVLPQDMSLNRMLEVIKYVHNADIRLDTPLIVNWNTTILEAKSIINKRSHQVVVMVDKSNKPISVFKEVDFEWYDEHTTLVDLEKTSVIVWKEWLSDEEAFNIMEDKNISSLPIVNKEWILIWILTKWDTIRNAIYKPALNKNWKLDLAVALSLNWYKEKIDELIKEWVNTIFLDTAHGYSSKMLKVIDEVKSKYNDIIIIAWNVMTGKATSDLIDAWALWIKVWIWPWAMCTTRMMTWVWRPQFSAIVESSKIARDKWWFVIADWGIRYPRDLDLSIAGWATHIMLWTLLAWTFESPWDVKKESDNKFYKETWGMASKKAVNWRTKKLSRFEQAKRERFKEWVSNSKVYNIRPLSEVIDNFMTWLASSASYNWASNLEELYKKAIIWVQTWAGFQEWTPHWKK